MLVTSSGCSKNPIKGSHIKALNDLKTLHLQVIQCIPQPGVFEQSKMDGDLFRTGTTSVEVDRTTIIGVH